MTNKLILAAALATSLSLTLAACGEKAPAEGETAAAITKVAAPAGKSWSATVAATADGGMLMGNPDAPVKLVEYASLTCSHCADFSGESAEEIKRDFIETGRVSLEVRNFIRDPLDATAAALTKCAGVDRYFALTENVFASQAELFAGAQANGQAGENAMALPAADRFPALAKAWGVDKFFQARGMTAEQINVCLADLNNIEKLQNMTNDGTVKYQISGTPTFLLNGQVVQNATTWPVIRDRLRAAGAR
ncbi:MAG: hypothetical protein RLZZ58_538 [Pseudomonadota bacterium]